MSIVVFWVEDAYPYDGHPRMKRFADTELMAALKHSEKLRGSPDCSHVIISSELENSVGKAGVDSVENGKTPDGVAYTWNKRRGDPS